MKHQPTFDEVFATLPADGWLTRGEARLLWQAAQETEGAILECGSYQGRSTCLLASLGRPVYAVDPFDGFHDTLSGDAVYEALRRNLYERDIDNVMIFRYRVEDWSPVPVGMAYLDGDHSFEGTRSQIKKALECKPRVVAIHDCNDAGGGLEVRRAAVELLGGWHERQERLAVWVL